MTSITTGHWRKPGPTNAFDWEATYDNYEGGDPVGHGATEAEAIADLTENHPRDDAMIFDPQASDLFSFIALAAFVGAVILVAP